ncbi:MAG: hypothetical protein ACFCUJ_02260 [Thiotrichales bacterium]
MSQSPHRPRLLAIVDQGGYPDYGAVYLAAGFVPETVHGMRKGIARFQALAPDVVVTEFVLNTQFSFRIGNLESLMGALQRQKGQARLILLVDRETEPQLALIEARYPVFEKLFFPVDHDALRAAVERAANACNA